MDVKIVFNGEEGRFDIPGVMVRDNEFLNIEFVLQPIKNLVYIANVSNGKTSKFVTMSKHFVVSLLPEWLRECDEKITIDLDLRDYSGTLVYKKYKIEPLNVKKGENQLETTACMQEIERRLQIAEKKIETIEAFIQTFPTLLEEAKREAVIEAAGGDPMGA